MDIKYSIVYSKRKTLSIIVERDRSVIVRAPLNSDRENIERIVEQKARWIRSKIEHNQKYPSVLEQKEFVSGESLLYLGKPYKLFVDDEDFDGVRFDSNFFISKRNQPSANQMFRDWYFKSASEVIIPKAAQLAKQIGVSAKE